jgi:hypothetical protein
MPAGCELLPIQAALVSHTLIVIVAAWLSAAPTREATNATAVHACMFHENTGMRCIDAATTTGRPVC